MARRQLLTEDERRRLFGVPQDADALTRHYSFTRSDQELLAVRRGDANRLGFAAQLALLRHPGMALAHMDEPIDPLVAWLSERLEIPMAAFREYAGRAQTMTDHARMLAAALGLRSPIPADLPFMIEAAAKAAWNTDRGEPIAAGGFSFYTHLSDQHGSYSSVVVSATNHEAPYVLDGLLHHGIQLPIDTHYTDTGGASDHIFTLCAMLGIRFCPRLRDLPDRKLACIEPAGYYPDLQPLMGRRIKTDVMHEYWPEAVRVAASLYAGTVAPSVMLRKLAAYRRLNQLDLALQELGRIERTLFTLDWLESPELRRRSCDHRPPW